MFDELVAARRLRLTLAGVPEQPARELRPLEFVRPAKQPQQTVRTAERQEAIDALEHGAMARRFA